MPKEAEHRRCNGKGCETQADEECKALARRSQAVQRGLPKAANVDVASLLAKLNLEDEDDPIMSEAQQLVNLEPVELMQHDSIVHPLQERHVLAQPFPHTFSLTPPCVRADSS